MKSILQVFIALIVLATVACLGLALIGQLQGRNVGGSTNTTGKTVGELCFPGESKTTIDTWFSTLANDMAADDFGTIGIKAKHRMKCDEDTAFTFTWSVYKAASAQLEHAIIDQDTASTAFARNWNNG